MTTKARTKQTAASKKNAINHVPVSNRIAVMIIAGVVLLLYGQSLWFGFSWFDDDAILLRNETFISDISNLGQSLLRDAEFHKKSMELYRPLQNVSFMVDASLGGFDKPGIFHFTSILLHACTSLLLFFLLKRLGFSQEWSLAGALLLAAHPVFAFTVCWLPARGDLLLAFFVLASTLSFLIYLDKRKPEYLVIHLLTFLLALLAKESAVVLIPVLAFFYFNHHGKYQWERWHFAAGTGYVVILVLFFYLRSMSVSSSGKGALSLAGLVSNLPVIPEVILKFFIPWPLVALPFYSWPVTLGGIMVIGLLIFCLIKFRLYRFGMLAPFLWVLLFSLPAMIYRPQWSDYIYDYVIHRSYLPLIGWIILLLMMIRNIRWNIRPARVYTISVLAGIVLAVTTALFSASFRNPLNFWTYAVKTNPRSAFAQTYLGGARFFSGQSREALECYNLALQLKPDFREARMNRGIALASLGEHPDALADFDSCLKATPNDTMLLRYRALSLSETGDFPGALKDIKLLISLGDTSRRTSFQYGLTSLLTGNFQVAEHIFDSLVQLENHNQQYLRLAALSDLMVGKVDRSIERYRKLITLATPDQNAYANLAYALWEKGEYQEALNYFQQASRNGSEDLSINLGLLLTYYRLGDLKSVHQTQLRTFILNPALKNFDAEIHKMTNQGYLLTRKQVDVLREILKR
jgi:protein O-mannosyl-transferase